MRRVAYSEKHGSQLSKPADQGDKGRFAADEQVSGLSRVWSAMEERRGGNMLKRYTREEIRFIKDHVDDMTDAEIGQSLNRSTRGVKIKRQRIQYRRNHNWTRAETRFVEDHADDMTDREMADVLDRSIWGIRKKRCQLGFLRGHADPYRSMDWDYDLLNKIAEVSDVSRQTIQNHVVLLCEGLDLEA